MIALFANRAMWWEKPVQASWNWSLIADFRFWPVWSDVSGWTYQFWTNAPTLEQKKKAKEYIITSDFAMS